MKKQLALIVTSIAMVLSCQKAPEEVPVSSVSLDQASVEMVVGDVIRLSATVLPSDATDKSVKWSSSNTSVASVDGGNVVALAEGNTTITATAGEKTATCSVTVKKKIVHVTSVELNKTKLSLVEGDTETLTATVKPIDATDKTVMWSTSDASIAEVEDGVVIAKQEGKATITATAGTKSATCKVDVAKMVIPVESVELNKTTLELLEGESETLTVTINPDNATVKTVTWSTSNTSIATVENGKITAVMEGEATITAKVGEKSATCRVVVSKKVIPVASIELNKTELALIKGQSETLMATVKPDDATDKTVTWSSSNSNVAEVDQTGKIAAMNGGSATVKATAGDKEVACVVTVTVPVESVILDKTELSMMEGDEMTLTATVAPNDVTDKTVVWSTSDATIATVDNGKIIAIKEGGAVISAKCGDKSATCDVVVEAYNPDAIRFSDLKLKAKLIAAFDTNGDGYLSYQEAAAVSSGDEIKTALGSIKTYKSFDEFQYFTSVTDIPSEMFSDWVYLSNIPIPENISHIGSRAFKGCIKLESITIPNNVTSIDEYAFNGCTRLTSIKISNGVTTIAPHTFHGCESLTSIIIPDNVSSLGDSAFDNCLSLSSITLPSSINSIGASCFASCKSLSFIDIPNGVTSIGSGTFSSCENLASVVIPNSVTNIQYMAFYNCAGLSSILIPDSVTSISKSAFEFCTSLTSFTIPESISVIPERMLAFCSSLKDVVIPESVSTLSGWTFWGCSSLEVIDIPESVSSIGVGAFSECISLKSIVLPESVSSINAYTFDGCTNLASVVIPQGVTSIGGKVFNRCASLTGIELPNSLEYIESDLFNGCTSLASIVIPDEVKSIGTRAFQNCSSLISISLPASVKEIHDNAFLGCTGLTSITVLPLTPPAGGKKMLYNTNNAPIFVASEALESYKTAQYWSDYASRIQVIP